MDVSALLTLANITAGGHGLAGLLVLIGWVWLVVMGFQHHVGWGLLVLLLPGLGGLVFGIAKWPATQTPLILMVVGLFLGGGMRVVTFG